MGVDFTGHAGFNMDAKADKGFKGSHVGLRLDFDDFSAWVNRENGCSDLAGDIDEDHAAD